MDDVTAADIGTAFLLAILKAEGGSYIIPKAVWQQAVDQSLFETHTMVSRITEGGNFEVKLIVKDLWEGN